MSSIASSNELYISIASLPKSSMSNQQPLAWPPSQSESLENTKPASLNITIGQAGSQQLHHGVHRSTRTRANLQVCGTTSEPAWTRGRRVRSWLSGLGWSSPRSGQRSLGTRKEHEEKQRLSKSRVVPIRSSRNLTESILAQLPLRAFGTSGGPPNTLRVTVKNVIRRIRSWT